MNQISKVKHYKRNADGSLRFVGIEEYAVSEDRSASFCLLKLRDEVDKSQREKDLEEFEALVDAACE